MSEIETTVYLLPASTPATNTYRAFARYSSFCSWRTLPRYKAQSFYTLTHKHIVSDYRGFTVLRDALQWPIIHLCNCTVCSKLCIFFSRQNIAAENCFVLLLQMQARNTDLACCWLQTLPSCNNWSYSRDAAFSWGQSSSLKYWSAQPTYLSLFCLQSKSIPSFLPRYLFVSISSWCNPTGARKRENKNIHEAPAAPGMQEAALSDLAQTTILN